MDESWLLIQEQIKLEYLYSKETDPYKKKSIFWEIITIEEKITQKKTP